MEFDPKKGLSDIGQAFSDAASSIKLGLLGGKVKEDGSVSQGWLRRVSTAIGDALTGTAEKTNVDAKKSLDRKSNSSPADQLASLEKRASIRNLDEGGSHSQTNNVATGVWKKGVKPHPDRDKSFPEEGYKLAGEALRHQAKESDKDKEVSRGTPHQRLAELYEEHDAEQEELEGLHKWVESVDEHRSKERTESADQLLDDLNSRNPPEEDIEKK